MKALSLRQPWAAAVLHLGKRIENRRWNTTFRGEFLIHAAKGMTRAEYEGAVDFCEDAIGGPTWGTAQRVDTALRLHNESEGTLEMERTVRAEAERDLVSARAALRERGSPATSAPLAEHEDMGRWKRLPVWAQQELEKWRVDEAFQRGRADAALADVEAMRAVVSAGREIAEYEDCGQQYCGFCDHPLPDCSGVCCPGSGLRAALRALDTRATPSGGKGRE